MLAHPAAQHVTELPLDEDAQRTLATVLMEECSIDDDFNIDLLHNALNALRRRHLERTQRHLAAQLAAAERSDDTAAVARLMQEKMTAARALREL